MRKLTAGPFTGGFVESTSRLKEQPGKNIQVPGGPRLVRSLLAAEPIDEPNLMIHPFVLGAGMRLFEEKTELTVEVTDSATLSTGEVAVTYHPVSG